MTQQVTTSTIIESTRLHPPPRLRFLITTFPAATHMNPALRLAERLALFGYDVTFLTTDRGRHRITTPTTNGVSVVTFSDDEFRGSTGVEDFDKFFMAFQKLGSHAVRELIQSSLEEGRPYSCLLYTLLLPWVADVAAEFDLPAAMLWIQAATVFNIYYYFFQGFEDVVIESWSSCSSLKFPGFNELEFTCDDLPTTLNDPRLLKYFRQQFDRIDKGSKAKVLVNTFHDLESNALTALGNNEKLTLFAIGPLIQSVGGESDACIKWLDSKAKGSVVFVSFGSYATLSKPQNEEIAKGLLELGRPFLWVYRKEGHDEGEEKNLSCQEELEALGMIVPWCSQVAVLSHIAVGCFLSHCGWNSTLESLICGVPVVAFPQWVDQTTNAKLVEDVWKTGVRVKKFGGDMIVGGEEIKRCLELVMEDQGLFAKNAMKWKDLAGEAIKEGRSSHNNLQAFVAEVTGGNN